MPFKSKPNAGYLFARDQGRRRVCALDAEEPKLPEKVKSKSVAGRGVAKLKGKRGTALPAPSKTERMRAACASVHGDIGLERTPTRALSQDMVSWTMARLSRLATCDPVEGA